jgi:non-specific serine/threonine protein kinase
MTSAILDRKHNLPTQLTSLVGREPEVAEVKGLLDANRLVTLTGSGGVGKTRIALRVASDLAHADAYRDGVWLAQLAGLSDGSLLPQVLLAAVGGVETPGHAVDDALLEALDLRHLLLVIDNCEHLVDACAHLVERMLEALPELYVLATGREALGVPGEIAWRVPSLALPDSNHSLSAEQLRQYASVRLLEERAHAASHGFVLNKGNMAAVAGVCRRLDGIPLAIELAASRLPLLSPEQLHERLGDVFHVLSTGTRTAVPRQRTLWATVDWSYQLLSETERTIFRRCGVFAGGWTLEAAEEVCAGGPIGSASVLDLLGQLVSKSLVQREEQGIAVRYRMLEPIRQFSAEQLAADVEADSVHERHLLWLVGMSERAETELWGPAQFEWLEQLELEHDNIRGALEWSRATGQSELMLRLAAALARFWDIRGFRSEGHGWLAAALDATRALHTRERAQGLARAGYLAVLRNALSAADEHLAEALALAHELEDEETIGAALMIMGMAARARSQYGEAAAYFEQSLGMSRRAGHAPGIYTSLYLLASVVRFSGDYPRVIALHEESLALKRQRGDAWGIGASLFSLGSLARVLNQGDRAAELYRESLEVRWHLRDRPGISVCLESLAGLVDDAALATRLLGSAERLRELGAQSRRESTATAQLADRLRGALGEETYAAQWLAGRDLPLEQVVDEALGAHASAPGTPPLSDRAEPRLDGAPAAAEFQRFRGLVEDALRHLNNGPALRGHPLIGVMPSSPRTELHAAEAAALLRHDLLQAIERLRPGTPRPAPPSSGGGWLHYLILHESYVEERENKQIMLRYALAEGTYYRARRLAIDALADDLMQRKD